MPALNYNSAHALGLDDPNNQAGAAGGSRRAVQQPAGSVERGFMQSIPCCSVLVLRFANLRVKPGTNPAQELAFLHALKTGLDRATQHLSHVIIRLNNFQLPYYCICISESASPMHADLIVNTALRLHQSTSQVRFQNAQANVALLAPTAVCTPCIFCTLYASARR